MSKTKETHLWFANGDDEIQIESCWKELNKSVLNLQKDEPSAVYIIDDEPPGFLRAAVKLKNFTFRIMHSQSQEAKKAFSANGKRNHKNLKNTKGCDENAESS